MLMMAAMRGHPAKDRPLHRHGPQDREYELERAARLEGAMRQQPMKTDGNAQTGRRIHADEQAKLNPTESPVPKEENGHDQSGEGNDHH